MAMEWEIVNRAPVVAAGVKGIWLQCMTDHLILKGNRQLIQLTEKLSGKQLKLLKNNQLLL